VFVEHPPKLGIAPIQIRKGQRSHAEIIGQSHKLLMVGMATGVTTSAAC
jgi:hypothetical protein